MSKPNNTVTSTSLALFGLCQTKYYWRIERALRPVSEKPGEALTVGRAFHVGMDADDVDEGLKKIAILFAFVSDAVLPEQWFAEDALKAKTRAMVRRAWERWTERPDLRESVFRCALNDSSFSFAGKVDGLANGAQYDFKTVGNATEFLSSQRLSYQPIGYLWALGKEGHNIDRIVYRLIERPTIRRKKGGKKAEPESADEYEARCYEWLGEPGRLTEEEFFFTDSARRSFEEYLRLICQQLLYVRREGAWARNHYACRTWNRTCEYMGLCIQVADGTPLTQVHTDSYEVGDAHPELTPDVIVPSDEGPQEKVPF